MHIFFRVDSSDKIGMGHLIRCLVLAEALKEEGATCEFISFKYFGHGIQKIQSAGFKVHFLKNSFGIKKYEEIKKLSAKNKKKYFLDDAHQTIKFLSDKLVSLLVVDSYDLDIFWEKEILKNIYTKIMVIDDLANRHHTCDFLLDQNYYENSNERYVGLVNKDCRLLLGPRYSLLRAQFYQTLKKNSFLKSGTKKILFFMGGADFHDYTSKAVKAFLKLNMKNITAIVVIGKSYTHIKELVKLCNRKSNIKILHDINNMAEIMRDSYFFVGSGGSVTWERAAIGLPGVITATAENQIELSCNLANLGAAIYLGQASKVSINKISETLKFLLNQPYLLQSMSRQLMKLTDGLGVKKVIRLVLSKEVIFRKANISDLENIFLWRNDFRTRKFFFNSNEISFADHKIWLNKIINDSRYILLIATQDSKDVGVLRFDIDNNIAAISIYIEPSLYNKGIGTNILEHGLSWIKKNHRNIKQINAKILNDNIASEKAFMSAGFVRSCSEFKYVL